MVQRLLLGSLLCACAAACASSDDTVGKDPDATVGENRDSAALTDARGGGDIGTNCMATSECKSGLQCLEYAEFGNLGCRVRAKQCTLACDHPFGLTSDPYAGGLPASFPAGCTQFPQNPPPADCP